MGVMGERGRRVLGGGACWATRRAYARVVRAPDAAARIPVGWLVGAGERCGACWAMELVGRVRS
eukprot:5779182-Pleurochrysis_carterae.AAC.1